MQVAPVSRRIVMAREGCRDLWLTGGADLGAVLIEVQVADPVQPVLDPPVATDDRGEPGGAGLGDGQGSDRAAGFPGPFPLVHIGLASPSAASRCRLSWPPCPDPRRVLPSTAITRRDAGAGAVCCCAHSPARLSNASASRRCRVRRNVDSDGTVPAPPSLARLSSSASAAHSASPRLTLSPPRPVSGRPGESHPRAPTERNVTVSRHSALLILSSRTHAPAFHRAFSKASARPSRPSS